MRAVPQVRASAFVPFVTFLRQIGAPLEPMFERAAFPAAALERPEALIPLHQAGALLEHVARREGIADLGLVVGSRTPIEALGSFGVLLRSASTLHEALVLAVRMHPSFDSSGGLWLESDGPRLWLRHSGDLRIEHGRVEVEQFTVMMMMQLLRLAGVSPAELHLHAPAAGGFARLDALAGARIVTGAGSSGVAIPRRLLLRPLAAPHEPRTARRSLEQRLARSAPARDFPGSIQQVAATLLLDGYPSVERTATAVGMSVRTLQRRLAESGVSYSDLVDRERHRTAVRLLGDRGVTVTSIAMDLGYADLANFTHAFRRWTGVSPRAYRRIDPAPPRDPSEERPRSAAAGALADRARARGAS